MSVSAANESWLVAGLGNPGDRYDGTFHNLGFVTVDLIAIRASRGSSSGRWESIWKGLLKKESIEGRRVALIKPQTWMNLSGESVRPAAEKLQVPLERLIVVHDDVDLQPCEVRLKVGGGSGGHKGIESCIQHLQGDGFVRVRIGAGHHPYMPTEQWVLSRIPAADREAFERAVEDAAGAVEMVIRKGAALAMNEVNRRARPGEEV